LGFPTPPSMVSMARESMLDVAMEPDTVSPDVFLCLEWLWTEPISSAKANSSERATKAFVTSCDHGGGLNLYYLQGQAGQLALVELTEDVQGPVAHMPAADAAPLPALGMVLVLDQNRGGGGVSLFSGAVKVGRVTFDANPPPPVAHIASEISALNLGGSALVATTPVGTPKRQTDGKRSSSPLRSSKFATSSRPASAAKNFSPGGISPVIGSSDNRVVSISQTVLNSANLQLASGSTVRIRLPLPSDAPGADSSALVSATLAACCAGSVPRSSVSVLRARWFAARHAPGPASISPNREWKLFTQVEYQHCRMK